MIFRKTLLIEKKGDYLKRTFKDKSHWDNVDFDSSSGHYDDYDYYDYTYYASWDEGIMVDLLEEENLIIFAENADRKLSSKEIDCINIKHTKYAK